MIEVEKQVKLFIQEVLTKYPGLNIDYKYIEEDNQYDIWHTDSQLQFFNDEFANDTGHLIRLYFFNKGIFNISFGYDHYRYKKSLYTMQLINKIIVYNKCMKNIDNNYFRYKIYSGVSLKTAINNHNSINFKIDAVDSLSSYEIGQDDKQNIINREINYEVLVA